MSIKIKWRESKTTYMRSFLNVSPGSFRSSLAHLFLQGWNVLSCSLFSFSVNENKLEVWQKILLSKEYRIYESPLGKVHRLLLTQRYFSIMSQWTIWMHHTSFVYTGNFYNNSKFENTHFLPSFWRCNNMCTGPIWAPKMKEGNRRMLNHSRRTETSVHPCFNLNVKLWYFLFTKANHWHRFLTKIWQRERVTPTQN